MPPQKGNHRRRRPQRHQDGNSRTAPATVQEKHQNTSVEDDESTGLTCLVCVSKMVNVAVADCGHAVCASCSHRMRYLYQRTSCIVCKVENKFVCVVPVGSYEPRKTTATFLREDAARRGATLYHDASSDMFFVDDSLRKQLKLIAGFTCPEYVANISVDGSDGHEEDAKQTHRCGAPAHRNVGALRAHVREQHRSLFCDVCISSKVEYKSRLPLYPLDANGNGKKSTKLTEHMKKEHPMCRFCRIHLLDDDELFNHLQKNHESCHICERSGRSHEYFRNFVSLEAHYRAHHYVCEDPACRGLVFGSILDLQAHTMQRHRGAVPRNARGRRMQVDISELHAQTGPGRAQGGRSSEGVSGTAVPNPVFMSEEDVRQEQARQAERHANLRGRFNSTSVVFFGEGSTMTESERDSAENARRPSEVESPVPGNETRSTGPSSDRVTTRAGRQHRATPGGSSASRSGATRYGSRDTHDQVPTDVEGDSKASEAVGNPEAPDDGAFYERAGPESAEEMTRRSKKLISEMRSALDAAEFEQFRSFSGDFRQGRISGENYYDAAVEAFGIRRAVRDILPELVALLPNPSLKQELSRVCARRNPPPFDTSSRSGLVSGARPPTGEKGTGSADAFPSLGGSSSSSASGAGAARPVARMPVVPPTKNDFPRLGKTNKPEGPAGTRKSTSSQGSSSGAPGDKRQSAAAVLTQPSMNRIFGASPNPTISRAAALQTSAFPALSGSTSRPSESRPLGSVENNTSVESRDSDLGTELFPALTGPEHGSSGQGRPSDTVGNAPSAEVLGSSRPGVPACDVSDRAGAVWGGVAARGGKKRGPGRGGNTDRGAESNTPRKHVAEFPTLSSRESPAPDVAEKAGGGSSAHKVIDVTAMAKHRQSRSALPRVAGGGSYGFSWDRKKARSKQREVKREVQAQAESAARGPSNASRSGSAFDVRTAVGSVEEAVVEAVNNISVSPREPNDSVAGTEDSKKDSFDQFSYLRAEDSQSGSNPSNSFFDA